MTASDRDSGAREGLPPDLYRVLLEAVDTIVLAVDEGLTVRYASPSVTELLGVAPADVVGDDLADLCHEDDRGALVEACHRTVDEGGRTAALQHRARHADGSWRWLESVATTLPDPVAGDLALVLVCRDVTERRLSDQRLSQIQRLETAGRLAGGMAHEVNNALAAVLGNAELVELRHGDDAETMEDVAEIKSNAQRAADLVRQLRAMTSTPVAETKRLRLDRQIHALEPLLRRALGGRVTLEVASDGELWSVEADPAQLEQAVTNLALNARDAIADTGTVRIELRNRRVAPEEATAHAEGIAGEFVVLSVSDDGEGMDEATRSRVLEPFFTTKGDQLATGLGLSTVYGIVRQSMGFMAIDSAPGEGTRVDLFLPRVDGKSPAVEVDRPEAAAGGETVLVVDDEPGVLRMVSKVLRARGYEVLAADGAGRALEIAAEHQGAIDLLLTDVVMPETSGPELAQQLLTVRPGTPVIYMSGYTDDRIAGLRDAPEAAGMVDKPFSAAGLVRLVRKVLDEA